MERSEILLAIGILVALFGFIGSTSISNLFSMAMIIAGVILIFVGMGVDEKQLKKIF